jgi:hypothetical protein
VSTGSLDAARAAAERLAVALRNHPRVNGVGIARQADAYVVKVLLVEATDDLPAEQNGVPVISEVVGPIHRRCL